MLSFSPLSLKDRERYEQYYRVCQVKSSAYSFFALLGWGVTFPIDLAWSDNLCWIRPSGHKTAFYAPVGDWNSVSWRRVLGEYFAKGNVMLNVPDKLAKLLIAESVSDALDFQLVLTESRNDWEYLYNISDLVSLKGSKYARIRNHTNKFFTTYSWEYLRLTPQYFPEVQEIQDSWSMEQSTDTAASLTLTAENNALRKALECWDEFAFIGGLLKVDGRAIGYTIAEVLDGKTIDTRFEKVLTGYSGGYQTLQHLFLKEHSEKYVTVNREEDLGISGLRKAKMSYRPSAFIKKCGIEFV